jgi:hypothetical protein
MNTETKIAAEEIIHNKYPKFDFRKAYSDRFCDCELNWEEVIHLMSEFHNQFSGKENPLSEKDNK